MVGEKAVNAEQQNRPFMPVMTDMDDLKRCEHGFPVEIAPCPLCETIGKSQISGWTCKCGADYRDFEFVEALDKMDGEKCT